MNKIELLALKVEWLMLKQRAADNPNQEGAVPDFDQWLKLKQMEDPDV